MRHWTAAEDERLRRYMEEGLTYEQAGRRLDRTGPAARRRAGMLGIKMDLHERCSRAARARWSKIIAQDVAEKAAVALPVPAQSLSCAQGGSAHRYRFPEPGAGTGPFVEGVCACGATKGGSNVYSEDLDSSYWKKRAETARKAAAKGAVARRAG